MFCVVRIVYVFVEAAMTVIPASVARSRGTIPALAWMSGSDTLAFFGIYPTWITLGPQLILLVITVITFIMMIRKGSKSKKTSQDNAPAEQ